MNLLSSNDDLRESAKHYVSQGNKVVTGVLKEVNGKKEAKLTRWKDDKHCLSTIAQVDGFFDKYKQTNLIALRCDLLTVIDIDNHGKESAISQLEKLCKRVYGDEYVEEVYATATQYSLNKGIHLIFKNDPDLRKTNLRELMGLDIDIQTSQSSLITMCPTGVNGKQYKMVCGEVLDFPFRIKELILSLKEAEAKKRSMKFNKLMNRLDAKKDTVNQVAYMEKVLEAATPITEGNRNDKLFRACCAWLNKLSIKNAYDLLLMVNVKCVNPQLPDDELQTIFNQANSMNGEK